MTRLQPGEAEKVKDAGERLKNLRENIYGYDQRTVMKMLDGRIINQQLSKIEGGEVSRPSMHDLCALGALYGLSPNQMAKLYGYWEDQTPSLLTDKRIIKIIGLLGKLPEKKRDSVVNSMEVSVTLAAAQAALPAELFEEDEAMDLGE